MFKVYHRYILRRIIIAFIASALIISLCLISLYLLRMIKNARIGFSFWLFITAAGYLNLFILAFSIPLSVLVAVLLVFGRMSSDNEITGFRASGLRIWQISLPVIVFSAAISFCMLYVNGIISPRGHRSFNTLTFLSRSLNPLNLFKPREQTDFGGYTILVDRVEGNKLFDLSVTEQKAERMVTIKAKWGELIRYPGDKMMRLELHNTDLTMPVKEGIVRERDRVLSIEFDLAKILGRIRNEENVDDLTIKELLVRHDFYKNAAAASKIFFIREIYRILNSPQSAKYDSADKAFDYFLAIKTLERRLEEAERMSAQNLFEIHKRLVLSSSCLIFAIIAVPLGISTHRRERSVNVMIGVMIALVYYAAIITIEKSVHLNEIKPYLLWIPASVTLTISALLFRRLGKGSR